MMERPGSSFMILIAICFIFYNNAEESVIIKQLAQCELESLKLGSEMADIINSPLGSESWSQRVNQDWVTERLGFAPFMLKGVHGSGLTATKGNAKILHENGNWSGKSIDDSPYHVLNHKWIYMLGDSTTRQIWASFGAPFQSNNFERNAKEWVRQYVRFQSNLNYCQKYILLSCSAQHHHLIPLTETQIRLLK